MKSKLVMGVALLAATTLVGCGNDDNTDDNTILTQLRAVQAASNSPNVDVYVNGNLIATNIPYTTSTLYATPQIGTAQVTVTPAGNPNQLLLDQAVTLQQNVAYTALLLSGADNLANTGVLVANNPFFAPNVGNFFGQFVHGTNGAGAIDIYVAPANQALPATPTVSNLSFANQFPTDGAAQNGIEFFGGNTRIRVTPAGDPNTILFDRANVNLNGNEEYIFVVNPRSTGTSAQGNLEVLAVPYNGNAFIIQGDALL